MSLKYKFKKQTKEGNFKGPARDDGGCDDNYMSYGEVNLGWLL